MTAIDTTKLVCPPLASASEREWHLYNSYRREQGRADAATYELGEANRLLKVSNWIRWLMAIWTIIQAIILRTIPDEHVSAEVAAILEWMI